MYLKPSGMYQRDLPEPLTPRLVRCTSANSVRTLKAFCLGFLLSSKTNRPGPGEALSVVSALFKLEENLFESLNEVKAITLLVLKAPGIGATHYQLFTRQK